MKIGMMTGSDLLLELPVRYIERMRLRMFILLLMRNNNNKILAFDKN